MEPLTLITVALTLATPYLIKTGEAIAQEVGKDIWNIIKKPFVKNRDELNMAIDNQKDKDKFVALLLNAIDVSPNFKQELESVVSKGQEKLNVYYQQNINNNGQIDKQINIQHNSGNIHM